MTRGPIATQALGIDLGGSSIKSVLVTEDGQVLSQQNLEFRQDECMDWGARIREIVSTARTQASPDVAIGLSAPGLTARDARSIAFMPGRLSGLEGLNWTNYLSALRPVPVLNDAHAALLGETWRGAAAGLKNVMMLTLGTGVGGAAMVDGRLLRGHLGRAGHLGHICLDLHGPPGITRVPGSLEWMIGNYSIRERSDGRYPTTHDMIRAHLAGDALATQLWLDSVRALACGISSLINVLDPEAVVIGGGIARAGETLFEPLSEFLGEVEWRPGGAAVVVMAAKLGEYAGAMGAAAQALEAVRGV